MGFKEWLTSSKEERLAKYEERKVRIDARAERANARMRDFARSVATSGSFAGVYLTDGMIGWTDQGRARREPVTGARAEVAVGADAQRRITATRIVLIGVFALAFRKQKGTGFLTIEADTYYLGVPFPIKDERDARAFAAKVNAAARNGLTSAE